VREAHEPGSYLRDTLAGQPERLAAILADRSAAQAAARLAGCSRIFVVGTGTSYHGALDVFAARTDRWLVITGEGSPLEGEGIVRTVEQEQSSVHTASHTGAMLRLAQVAAVLGDVPWASELAQIPGSVASAFQRYRTVTEADARDIELRPLMHFVGGGPARATAYEGALKIREASHVISAEGHDLEGVLHGPLVSIQRGQAVVLVAHHGRAFERTVEVAQALSEIATNLILVGSAAGELARLDGVRAVDSYETASHDEVLAPIVNVVPLQLLAYAASRHVGVDADSFRRDEAEYAAAQAQFTL